MVFASSCAVRSFILSFVCVGLVAASPAPQRKTQAPAVAAPQAATPWLYVGSDIPVDKGWTFGVLPNGLRYAVRRNGVPPGQVSIRVAIDAGSLMEEDHERGFAHFLEHLSFRGSKFVADGEAKRVWQRLGASFGSDTNAETSATQTIYKLDLPNATMSGLDESIKILSGMMAGPSISDAEVETERRTVLAEAREQNGPQVRVRDATTALFFSGQRLENRSPIGTTQTLVGATAPALRAFHDRWYRPDKAIIAISGDVDPAQSEALIKTYFSGWKVSGPATPDPDFGSPSGAGPLATYLSEPGLPTIISMAILRPWKQKNDTIVYNQGRLIDLIATRLISRRLEERARAGGSFLQADASQDDVARTVDGTFVSIVPVGNDWKPALSDVRAVIADAIANPPTQAEIDRESGEFVAALDVAVETERAEASAKQADDIIAAVNIRETVATAAVARDVFGAMKGNIRPADILASTKRLFSGLGPRVLVTSPAALPSGSQQVQAELAKPVSALASNRQRAPVSFDRLPTLGPPGRVIDRSQLAGLSIETATLSNGVKLIMSATKAEAGRVYVSARFGAGRQAFPKDKPTPAWAAGAALIAGGIGDLGQDEIDRMTSGRQINMAFEIGDDAFILRGVTREADLKDQLRTMATKFAAPRWDAAPVARARAAMLIGLDTQDASPQGVLGRDLGGLLHKGDQRWESPRRADVEALTPQTFRAFWAPLLAAGPIELSIFGDFDSAAALSAVEASFGALKARPSVLLAKTAALAKGPSATKTPLIKLHKGAPDQAIAVLAWPTGGGADNLFESRKLDVLAAIFNDRMFEQFREGEGASYSPDASSNWPLGMDSGGSFVVSSQIKPDSVDRFYIRAKAIAADFVATPVTADELARAVGPMRQQLARAASGNNFWMSQLSGATSDPRKVTALKTLASDLQRITPQDLQASAKTYFVDSRSFSVAVLPEGKPKSAKVR